MIALEQTCADARQGEHLDFQNFGEVSHAVCGLRHNQRSLAELIESLQRRHEDYDRRILELNEAFPDKDKGAHLRYHNSLITKNEELRRLRIAIQEKTITGLVFGALVWIALAAWNAFKASVFR